MRAKAYARQIEIEMCPATFISITYVALTFKDDLNNRPHTSGAQGQSGNERPLLDSNGSTFRTWRDVRLEAVMRLKADIGRPI